MHLYDSDQKWKLPFLIPIRWLLLLLVIVSQVGYCCSQLLADVTDRSIQWQLTSPPIRVSSLPTVSVSASMILIYVVGTTHSNTGLVNSKSWCCYHLLFVVCILYIGFSHGSRWITQFDKKIYVFDVIQFRLCKTKPYFQSQKGNYFSPSRETCWSQIKLTSNPTELWFQTLPRTQETNLLLSTSRL